MKKGLILLFFSAIFLFWHSDNVYAINITNESCPLTAGFWVEEGTVKFMKQNYNVEFSDWANKQMEAWNKILAQSDVRDCYKIGKIVSVTDGALPLNGGVPTNNPDKNDLSIDVQWGFPASLVKDKNFWDKVMINDKGIDWGLLHELSHARYLIDEYQVDTYADEVKVTDSLGKPVVGNYIKIIGQGNMVYRNNSMDLMAGGEHKYAEHSVKALNLIAGKHNAKKNGNWNYPTNIGIYLEHIPKENYFKILDVDGNPLPYAGIRVFQSVSRQTSGGRKEIDNKADIEDIFTNQEGLVAVGSNPFGENSPFFSGRRIDPLGGNSVLLLEVSYKDQWEYRFVEVSYFNLAYWKGYTDKATYIIKTKIKNTNSLIDNISDKLSKLKKELPSLNSSNSINNSSLNNTDKNIKKSDDNKGSTGSGSKEMVKMEVVEMGEIVLTLNFKEKKMNWDYEALARVISKVQDVNSLTSGTVTKVTYADGMVKTFNHAEWQKELEKPEVIKQFGLDEAQIEQLKKLGEPTGNSKQ